MGVKILYGVSCGGEVSVGDGALVEGGGGMGVSWQL